MIVSLPACEFTAQVRCAYLIIIIIIFHAADLGRILNTAIDRKSQSTTFPSLNEIGPAFMP